MHEDRDETLSPWFLGAAALAAVVAETHSEVRPDVEEVQFPGQGSLDHGGVERAWAGNGASACT